MNTPSIKITITGYNDLSISAEIPFSENGEMNEHEYFMASINLLLQAADFCEPELTDISDTTL
jgi:hypothetical protein